MVGVKAATALDAVPAARRLLPYRELIILQMRSRGDRLADIGLRCGGRDHALTPERVKQLEDVAVDRLRSTIANTPQSFYHYERFG